ncbi:MAG: hypothetical protein ACP5KD_05315 [Fervidobacterium sp.]
MENTFKAFSRDTSNSLESKIPEKTEDSAKAARMSSWVSIRTSKITTGL